MKNTIDLLFYNKFILLTEMRARVQSKFVRVNCIGANDGEVLDVYTNGKKTSSLIVRDGFVILPIEKDTNYRIASNNFPYGFKFNTLDAHDDTGDTFLFQTLKNESGELKNIYRLLEVLCQKAKQHEEKIAELSGYQTE